MGAPDIIFSLYFVVVGWLVLTIGIDGISTVGLIVWVDVFFFNPSCGPGYQLAHRELRSTCTRYFKVNLKSAKEKRVMLCIESSAIILQRFQKYSKGDGSNLLKMTVRGTMVRSEVCNSWCFCLES